MVLEARQINGATPIGASLRVCSGSLAVTTTSSPLFTVLRRVLRIGSFTFRQPPMTSSPMRVLLLLPWIAKLYQQNLPLYSLKRNVPGVCQVSTT